MKDRTITVEWCEESQSFDVQLGEERFSLSMQEVRGLLVDLSFNYRLQNVKRADVLQIEYETNQLMKEWKKEQEGKIIAVGVQE